ncbi:SDR family oxidoreductase [Bradyrhizobium viridifuturi]|jgi:3-oxoacyl-[acyl-carrier protein] reductase|uniref:SDR family NAD(P)-dependent oxidoreductase n=2 Tax=Nitrobacteraceae TaxID=41294 RepID=UPI00039858EB|nr:MULTISPECIES: SDR family oxidoreductase [Bradyrhizobium]ERF79992.1 MAG: 3-oxoacyl-[acyl-carrier protein] reductase [Bradyrhizobium sp. DFCI-1]OYU61403.1 MAG: 3-ketoacyl-ACP reductase [Bradyrhizobium sp. PARBB1]PSO14893.1 KR domain-containing protein [Bradyrhizobium sp. MOS004]QRI72027.1 SDR family oxidoreductase [Bradyrhizobium sp. PSBB068]MBR1021961.1 SDR family oxidoreductase [Bradyrhizobium viridifuturi]
MQSRPFSLDGRVAIVTGGGRGIGAAIVTRLAQAGATVVIANRTADVAEALARGLAADGRTAHCVPFERLDRSSLRAMVDDIAARYGRLDIVVHNAGGCPWASLDELDEAKLDETLRLNLSAGIWLAQAAIPHMRANGFGRILVTSSVSARVTMGGGAHYSAAKAGVNAFIRGAAFELARDGITVNGVEAGFIEKPGRGTMSAPENKAKLERFIPMGRMGSADDIACAMLYLASTEARYVTGQTIVVDGGSTLPETGFAVERQWGI